MDIHNFIIDSADFFDYIEKKLNESGFLVIGAGGNYLLKTKELWKLLNGLKKKGAEDSLWVNSRSFNVRLRKINAIIEISFEGEKKEFFKFSKANRSKQNIFKDKSRFIDLDELKEEKTTQVISFDFVTKEISQIIKKLETLELDEKEIRNILQSSIDKCLKEN